VDLTLLLCDDADRAVGHARATLSKQVQAIQRAVAGGASKAEAEAEAEDDAALTRTARTVRLRRVATPPPTVLSRQLLNGRAHVLRISSFGATTAAELRTALRTIRGGRATSNTGAGGVDHGTLIFDLRGNEGGLLPEAIAACRMVLPLGGHVVSLKKEEPSRVAKAFRRRWYHRSELPRLTPAASTLAPPSEAERPSSSAGPAHAEPAPLVVLVNGLSASSAEVFAGALAHAGALVIGTRTYGKGSSQAVVYQSDGHAVSYTAYTLAVGAAEGSAPLSRGVHPHVPWRWRCSPAGPFRAADDAEIERALSAAAAWVREHSWCGGAAAA
jgi:C-terminal processing protease CtpA/Prc